MIYVTIAVLTLMDLLLAHASRDSISIEILDLVTVS